MIAPGLIGNVQRGHACQPDNATLADALRSLASKARHDARLFGPEHFPRTAEELHRQADVLGLAAERLGC